MKPINTWSEIKPGDVVINLLNRQLYLAVSAGNGLDGINMVLIHKDNYIQDCRPHLDDDEMYYEKVECSPIRSWDDVRDHDLVVCMDPVEGGCTNEVRIDNTNETYITSTSYMWPIYQFNHRDWRVVEPDCKPKIEGEVE